MKRLFPIFAALLAIVMTACSSDDDNTLSVSFEQASYALTTGSVTVNISVKNAPETATEIPVTVAGTAIADQDYTISSRKFVVGGASPVTSITVTAKNNFSDDRTIILTLAGVATGANASTTIALGKQDKMLYSFAQKAFVMGGETDVEFDLLNIKTGNAIQAERDIDVAMAVDKTQSTAVEGVNFEFVGGNTATIKKGEGKCLVRLKTLKAEAGKNIIVLAPQVTETEGFVAGAFPTATVTMIGSYASDLLGEWVMKEIVTTKADFIASWGCSENDAKGWPEFNAADTFTFSGDGTATGYKLTTSLKSELANYFYETSDFSFDREATYRFDMAGGKRTLQLLRLANVNRYFSATEKSADREALIGVRNITDEKTGETLLNIYIIDYNSRSFAYPMFDDYGMYDTAKPTASMGGMDIEFTLRKK